MDKDSAKKIFAGLFFIVGMLLTVAVILTLGKDKGFTQEKFQVTIVYKDVGGLLEGAPVRLSGVTVGNVAHIGFLDEEVGGRRVYVKINIFEEFRKQLNHNAKFAIKTQGVLGEKLIEIEILDAGEKIDLTKSLIGEESFDVTDLAVVFARAAESFTQTTQELRRVDIKELAGVLEEAAKSLAMTSRGLAAILEEAQYITAKSKRLLDRVEQKLIDGTLFKVF